MAKFSLGRDDDWEGSSSPDPKRLRTTIPSRQQQEEQNNNEEDDEEEEELIPAEEVESDNQEEEDEEEEEEEGEEQEEEEEEEEEESEDDEEHVEVERESYLGNLRRTSVSGEESNGAGKGSHNRDTVGPHGDGCIPVTLTDPDVLDCPICLESLTIPVFQCENGHIACSSCCGKLKNRCPSCCWPIGYNRCRAIEKVIESVTISCLNVKYGCKETVIYSKKHNHEHMCLHAPCSCPLRECNFVGSSKNLYLHFSTKHSSSALRFIYGNIISVTLRKNQKHVILQERGSEGVIFVLNHSSEGLGSVINVDCIGPSTSERGYFYEVKAKKGEMSVGLQSFTESISEWSEHPPRKAFLMVPQDFISLFGLIKLQVCIRRLGEGPAGI